MTSFVSHSTNIGALNRHRADRGVRYSVSGHIRPGEYTWAYEYTKEGAQKCSQRFRERGCHQITITPPITPPRKEGTTNE